MPDGPVTPHSVVLEFVRANNPPSGGFRPEHTEYICRGTDGEYRHIEVPWSPERIEEVLQAGQPDRPAELAERVGLWLAGLLEPLGWSSTLGPGVRRWNDAGAPVRVTIRTDDAQLNALPWELLPVDTTRRPLASLANVLLHRECPETATTPERPARVGPGRVLFAWSAAGGQVPAGEHLRALLDACRDGHLQFDAYHDVLGHATLESLVRKIAAAHDKERPYAVLHLLCHGASDSATFGLMLDGPVRGFVDAAQLRDRLAPHAATLRLVVLASCDGDNPGVVGNVLGSIAQELHRGGFQGVLATRNRLSTDASTRLAQTFYRALIVELHSLENAFLKTREALASDPVERTHLQLYIRSADGHDIRPLLVRPYRGLSAFTPRDARFFFGREADTARVLDLLQELRDRHNPRLVIVAGVSGTGKSSLVQCGVLPALADHTHAVLRPGADPMTELERVCPGGRPGARPFLLFVDQFEELFTHIPDDQHDRRQRFVDALWRMVADDLDVTCILALRVDFLGRCGEFPLDAHGKTLGTLAYTETHRHFVEPMDRSRLRAAILRPAEAVGLTVDPGVCTAMLDSVVPAPGALPLMQYTLDLLWEEREGRSLVAAVYDKHGGVAGTLAGRADELFVKFDPTEQHAARRLLTALVQLGGANLYTRRRRPLRELRPADAPRSAVFARVHDALVQARMVTVSETAHEATIEVAHEALIHSWSKMQAWLAADLVARPDIDRVEAWVAQWKDHKTIPNKDQMALIDSVAAQRTDDLSPATTQALPPLRRQVRRRAWLRRGIVVGMPLLLVAIVAAIIVWYDERLATLKERESRADTMRFRANRALFIAGAYEILDIAAFKLRVVDVERVRGVLLASLEDLPPPLHRIPWALPEGLTDFDMSPDASLVAVCKGSAGCTVYHNDTSEGWPRARLEVLRDMPECDAMGTHAGFDGNEFLYCGHGRGLDTSMLRIDVSSGEVARISSQGYVKTMPSPQGEFIAASDSFPLVFRRESRFVGSPRKDSPLQLAEMHPQGLNCSAMNKEYYWTSRGVLAGSCADGWIFFHDPRTERTSLERHDDLGTLLAVTGDEQAVIVSSPRGYTGLYRRGADHGFKLTRTIDPDSNRHAALNEGETVAALVRADTLSIIDLRSGDTLDRYIVPQGLIPRFLGPSTLLLLPHQDSSKATRPLMTTVRERKANESPPPPRVSVDGFNLAFDGVRVADLSRELELPNDCPEQPHYYAPHSWWTKSLSDGSVITSIDSGGPVRGKCTRRVGIAAIRRGSTWEIEALAQCDNYWGYITGSTGIMVCPLSNTKPGSARFRVLTAGRMAASFELDNVFSWAVDETRSRMAILGTSADRTKVQIYLVAQFDGSATPLEPRLVQSHEPQSPCTGDFARLAFQGDLVAFGCDQGAEIWDLLQHRRVQAITTTLERNDRLDFSAQNDYLLIGDAIWGVRTGERLPVDGSLLGRTRSSMSQEYTGPHKLAMAQMSVQQIMAELEAAYGIRLSGTTIQSTWE